MISGSPDILHIYDAGSNSDTTVALPSAPLGLSVSPDGLHAAVGHAASVSYVNLQTARIEQTFALASSSGAIALGSNYIYVFAGLNGNGLTSIELSTGTTSTTAASTISSAGIDPVTNGLYAAPDYGTFITRYDISSGPAGTSSTGYQFGNYSVCGGLWFSPDGSRIYNGCGEVFASSNDPTKDMRYSTSFTNLTGLQSAASSTALDRLAVIPTPLGCCTNPGAPPPPNDSEVHLFEAGYLNEVGRFVLSDFRVNGNSYQAHGHSVFFSKDSSVLYVVMEADSTSGLLNDFAIQTIRLANPTICSATFTASSATSIASGGIGPVGIASGTDCSFSAVSNDDWITLVSGYYGSGPSTLTYLVRPNSQSQPRTGTITLGSQTFTVTQDGAAANAAVMPLSFNVVGADYSKGLDKLVLVTSAPNELHIYDPSSRLDQVVPLPAAPLSVSVRPDGLYAAVGHDGWISYVNLKTGKVEQIFQETTDVNSLVLAGNGYIYVFPKRDSANIYSLAIASGTWTPAATFSGGSIPRLHPSGKYLYSAGNWTMKWDIENGPATAIGGISAPPTTCGDLWLSEDGQRIFSACGDVYHTSDIPVQDFTPNGSLIDSAVWVADSKLQQKTAVIPGAFYTGVGDTMVQLYSYPSLTLSNESTLPDFQLSGAAYASHGRFLFWDSTESKLITVVQADASANLTSSYGVYVIDQPASLPACAYSLDRNSISIGPDNENFFVRLTANCTWKVLSQTSWIYAAGNLPTNGSATISLTAQQNQTGVLRTGSIIIGGQTITVTQDPDTCTVNANSSSSQFNSNGGVQSIFVTAGSSCGWSAESDSSWINVTTGASGTGNGKVTYSVDPFANGSYRSGGISIAGQYISISQSGGPAPVNTPLRFVPITPCRAADTRLTGSRLYPNLIQYFILSNSGCGVPITAQAYSINVTAVPSGPLGYLTVGSSSAQPFVSTLNALDGRVKANAVIVAALRGAVTAVASNSTDLVLDVNGYFVDGTGPSVLAFYPLAPCRVLDTRNGGPPFSALETRDVAVQLSACNVPATAQAYSLNFTAIPHEPLGYLTVWPKDEAQPLVSTLNAPTGTVTANAAIVPAGTAGDISVFATNQTDLVIDINGYFAPPAAGGLSFYPVAPCRALDTRYENGLLQGALSVNVNAGGCAVPANAAAFVMNATVVPSGGLGYLTLWPDGATQPVASTLNALDGAITSNMAIVPSTNGSIDAYTSNQTQLILDLSGYFAP